MALGIGKLKSKFEAIRDESNVAQIDNNCFGFISLNKGGGSKTVASAVALELSKKYRVCVVDCNFVQPGMGVLLETPIRTSMSVMNYFTSSAEIPDCIHPVKNQKNMWIVSTSPVDSPQPMADLRRDRFKELIEYLKKSFDLLIFNISYNPFAEWFILPLGYLDKGYIVWDEQTDNIVMTEAMISYVHQTTDSANIINNIIINKKTRYPIQYEAIKRIECELMTEIPFDGNIMLAKNEGKILLDNKNIDKRFFKEISKISKDIESHRIHK